MEKEYLNLEDYQRQVEQVDEARKLNQELDENTKITKYALWVAVLGVIVEIIQLLA